MCPGQGRPAGPAGRTLLEVCPAAGVLEALPRPAGQAIIGQRRQRQRRWPSAVQRARTAAEGGSPRINRSTHVRVDDLPGEQVQVKVRERVPMDLVVHLHRPGDLGDSPSRSHGVLPEGGLLGRRQLVRLNHMRPRYNADVGRERALGRRRHPAGGRLGKDVEGRSVATYDAPFGLPAPRPLLRVGPDDTPGGAQVGRSHHEATLPAGRDARTTGAAASRGRHRHGLVARVRPPACARFLARWWCRYGALDKTQGIDDALIQPYSRHASRTSLEIYSRIALSDAQASSDNVIDRFPCDGRWQRPASPAIPHEPSHPLADAWWAPVGPPQFTDLRHTGHPRRSTLLQRSNQIDKNTKINIIRPIAKD